MAAPSKFTKGRQEAVLESLRAGVSLADSCRPLDVSAGSVSNWISRGRREQSGPFADFARDVERARAEREREVAGRGLDTGDLLRLLERAARRGSVAAAKYLLERHDREQDGAGGADGGFDGLAHRRWPGAA